MTRISRCNHTPAFKAKGTLAAIRGEKTLAELAQQFDVHANQIVQWRDHLLKGATGVFGSEAQAEASEPSVDVTVLHARIGQFSLENDFYRGAHQTGIAERKAMIDLKHDPPIIWQATVLGISRGSVCYKPRPVCASDFALMREIDVLHLGVLLQAAA